MAGYSGKPLIQKFGVKPDMRLALWHTPATFPAALDPLPAGVCIVAPDEDEIDCVLLFSDAAAALADAFPRAKATLTQAGMLWVAWPKKSSGVATDLTEDVVRRIGLDAGLVDVKVCAIDAVWSGLKFVRRVKDRKATASR